VILNIANGIQLKKYLTNKCAEYEDIIAFNESMITGECNEKIFSETFFQIRAKSLNVDFEQYLENTVSELYKLLNKQYSEIILWFDEDMFCQINLLTLCAYFDYINYKGVLQLNIIRQDFGGYHDLQSIVIKSYKLSPQGYYSLYQDVMLKKVFTKNDYHVFKEIENGIKLYENYISDNSEIILSIAELVKDNRSKRDIIKEICKRYPQYGIGDYNIELLYHKEMSGRS